MRTAALILCLIVFGLACAQADPCRQPLRIFDGQRVSLEPLFAWWQKPAAWQKTNARPLSAWVRITGTIEKEAGVGWVLNAQVWDAPQESRPMRLLLRRPPTKEKQTFEEASAIQERLLAQSKARASDAAAASGRANALNDRAQRRIQLSKDAPVLSRSLWPSITQDAAVASRHSANANAARNQSAELKAAAEAQRDRVPAHLKYSPEYRIDLFALKTGQTWSGMPVFDPGLMR